MIGPPLISLFSNIAILIWTRLLSYIVEFYLIIFGGSLGIGDRGCTEGDFDRKDG